MLYLGLNAGVLAGNIAAHAAGIDAFRVFGATMLLTVPALFGSRLLGALTNWQRTRRRPRRFWGSSQGGGQYGGLILALPLSVPLLRLLHLSLGAFWDVAMFTILVAMFFGRIGCWLHGCCTGRRADNWMTFNSPDSRGKWHRRYPTQLLEAAWSLVLLVLAVAVWRRMPFPGALFLFISAIYAIGRVFMESLREHLSVEGSFTIHHGISVAMIVLCTAALVWRWPK